MSVVPKYPVDRPKFFAMKVIREMALSGEIQTMGQTAAMLVTIVASFEDQKGYKAPPDFYTEQLLNLLGVRKWEALDRARKAAVDAGWLEYIAPAKGSRKPGKYWVRLPDDPPQEDIEGEKQYPSKGDRKQFDTPDDTPDHIRETDIEGGNEGGNSLPLPITKPQHAAVGDLKRDEYAIAKRVREELTSRGIDLSSPFWPNLINLVARCDLADGVLNKMLDEIERPGSSIKSPGGFIFSQFKSRLEAEKSKELAGASS